MNNALISVTCVALLTTPALAQNFTTAAEVKPILEMTKSNWIAVREYDGQDLLYFTQILSWRCGLDSISYAVNGGDATKLATEPCYAEEGAPNALKMDTGLLPYVALPLGAVEDVTVTLTYDDGTSITESFAREAVQIQ